jgi:hypothetical protein
MLQVMVPNWKKNMRPMSIRVEVYAWSKSNNHDFLGQATIPFRDHKALHTTTGKWVELWLKLEKRTSKDKVSGDIHIGVRCIDLLDQRRKSSLSPNIQDLPSSSPSQLLIRPQLQPLQTPQTQQPQSTELKIDTQKSVVEGLSSSSELKTDSAHSFTVKLVDDKGNMVTDESQLQYSIEITRAADGSKYAPDNVQFSPGQLSVKFTPRDAGEYDIHILVNGDSLQPIRIQVQATADTNYSTIYGTLVDRENALVGGTDCEFYIQTKDKNNNRILRGGDNVQVQFKRENSEQIVFESKVVDNGDGTYKVSALPTVTGEFIADILLNGIPLMNELRFTVQHGTSADKSKVLSLRDHFPMLAPCLFTIQSCDTEGNERKEGGDKFEVTITKSDNSSVVIPSFIKDRENGKYDVSFVLPESEAEYDLNIVLNSNGGKVPVLSDKKLKSTIPLATELCYVSGNLVDTPVSADSQLTFKVHACDIHGNGSKIGNDPLSVTLNDQEVPFTDNNDGTYDVTIDIPASGKHAVDIKFDGRSIQQSPFTFIVNKNSPSPNHTYCTGPGVKKSYANDQKTHIVVHLRDDQDLPLLLRDSDKIELQFIDRNNQSVNINHELKPNVYGDYTIDYKVSVPKSGRYTLNVLLNGQAVKNTPHSVLVFDPDHVPDVSTSVVTDNNSQTIKVGDPYKCRLKLQHANGKPILVGSDDVQVTVKPLNDAANRLPEHVHNTLVSVSDYDNGVYGVEFVPCYPGEYEFECTVSGNVIHKIPVITVDKNLSQTHLARIVNRSFEISTFDTTGDAMDDELAEETAASIRVLFLDESGDNTSSESDNIAHTIKYIGKGKFAVHFTSLKMRSDRLLVKVYVADSLVGSVQYHIE